MQKLYYGGKILTMEGNDAINHEYPEAVLIEEGVIRYVGNLNEARELLEEGADTIDLKGTTLMPSFIDPHSHISLVATFSTFANLSDCNDFEQIKSTLLKYKDKNKINQNGIILGCSYDDNFLKEQAHPTKELLDQVSENIPIFIFHTSNHMGVANSCLLKLAGITKETLDPDGGKIGRAEDGSPDGYMEETPAVTMVMKDVFGRMDTDFEKQLVAATNQYFSHGITTVQDGASDYKTFAGISSYAKKRALHIDIISYIMIDEYDKTINDFREYNNQYQSNVKIGGMKIILDGSPQGRSAWLSSPYQGETEYCGYPTHSKEVVQAATDKAVRNKIQLLAHCNGDAAAQWYIDCFQASLNNVANRNNNNQNLDENNLYPDFDLRPVMIHCQTVRDDQLAQMKKISMIPSFFIAHTYYWGDVHLKNLGEVRGAHISPAKTALDLGMKYNFHQDSPVLKPDMLKTVWCAVNRITKSGRKIGEDQKIPVYDALKGVTMNAAYAYHEEKIKGSIRIGKLADLCILSENPLEIDPMMIDKIQVLETMKEGVTVYKHEHSNPED